MLLIEFAPIKTALSSQLVFQLQTTEYGSPSQSFISVSDLATLSQYLSIDL